MKFKYEMKRMMERNLQINFHKIIKRLIGNLEINTIYASSN